MLEAVVLLAKDVKSKLKRMKLEQELPKRYQTMKQRKIFQRIYLLRKIIYNKLIFSSWRHLKCYNFPKKFNDIDPTEIRGFAELEVEDRQEVRDHFSIEKKTQKSTTKKSQKQKP